MYPNQATLTFWIFLLDAQCNLAHNNLHNLNKQDKMTRVMFDNGIQRRLSVSLSWLFAIYMHICFIAFCHKPSQYDKFIGWTDFWYGVLNIILILISVGVKMLSNFSITNCISSYYALHISAVSLFLVISTYYFKMSMFQS